MSNQLQKPLSVTHAFLGRGWTFPPAFRTGGGNVDMLTDVENVQKSIQLIMATHPGERVMRGGFGCDLSQYAFVQMTESIMAEIEDHISRAITSVERRIILNTVNVGVDQNDSGTLIITIDYTISATNSRYNMVLPYFLHEAQVWQF